METIVNNPYSHRNSKGRSYAVSGRLRQVHLWIAIVLSLNAGMVSNGITANAASSSMRRAESESLKEPSFDCLPDDMFQLICLYLPRNTLGEWIRVSRSHYARTIRNREQQLRARPASVRLRIGGKAHWLDPAEESPEWPDALGITENLIEASACGLRPMVSKINKIARKTLLDRLAAGEWQDQILRQPNYDARYLITIAKILTRVLPWMAPICAPIPTEKARQRRCTQVFLGMCGYLVAAQMAANFWPKIITGSAVEYPHWWAMVEELKRVALEFSPVSSGLDVEKIVWAAAGSVACRAAQGATRDAKRYFEESAAANDQNLVQDAINTAYRASDVAVQLAMLERITSIIRHVFVHTNGGITAGHGTWMFGSMEGWEMYKTELIRSLGAGEFTLEVLQPWLKTIEMLIRMPLVPKVSISPFSIGGESNPRTRKRKGLDSTEDRRHRVPDPNEMQAGYAADAEFSA